MIHTRVTYSGNVQGVGFRFTCTRLAHDFAVAGFVQNLPDGTVRLEAEGTRESVEAFLSAVADAMNGHITGRDTTTGEARGDFGNPESPNAFGVRY